MFNIELVGQDKTKIKAQLIEKPDSRFIADLVRIDVTVEPGTLDFLRRNKVFYLKVLSLSMESFFLDENAKFNDYWIKLKQRIKKCNRCERLNWKIITFIGTPLTNLDVLKELHKE
jgi:hypothetical protein